MYRNLFFTAVVLLVGAAAWIFFTAIKKPAPEAGLNDTAQKPAAVVSAAQPAAVESGREGKPAVGQTKPGAKTQETPILDSGVKQENPAPTPVPAISENRESSRPGPVKESGSSSPLRSDVKSRPSSRSRFVLKGIIWSDNPARRVALINGDYLKEGEKIDGVELVRISRHEVVLRSGKREWSIKVQK